MPGLKVINASLEVVRLDVRDWTFHHRLNTCFHDASLCPLCPILHIFHADQGTFQFSFVTVMSN